jgi:SAM-dependent methyltransferase
MGEELRDRVRERYAGVARSVREGQVGACCGSDGRVLDSEAPGVDWTGGSYSQGEKEELPQAALNASLGCGNPVALATLSPGEVVLDLGSGGGIDVLLSARRVAPGGKAYGLDMTDEMLELARENRRKAGVENAEFLKGEIEDVPLPDDHVDVVISNCVINLSTAKERVIGEAFRVLKPGGRFAVSDMVFLGEKARLPEEVIRSVEMWAGCVSGPWRRTSTRRCCGKRASRKYLWRLPTPTNPRLRSRRVAAATPRRLVRFLWPARSSGPGNRPGGEGDGAA